MDRANESKCRRDLDWLVSHPDKTMGATYHDAGSCWQLIDAAVASIRELRAWKEAALGALGEHPDTDLDIRQRISDIRDEGRAHFHALTNMTIERDRLRADNAVLAAEVTAWREADDGTISWGQEHAYECGDGVTDKERVRRACVATDAAGALARAKGGPDDNV